jgi:cyclic-di-GMP phosphodiesterase TipF (flagellum assembly factor)
LSFLSSTVVVVAMATVSACLGALAFLVLRLDLDTSAVLALASFVVLVLTQFARWRGEDRRVGERERNHAASALEALRTEVAAVQSRIAALEGGAAGAGREAASLRADLDRLRGAVDGLGAELAARRAQPLAPAPAAEPEGPRRGRFAGLPRPERVAQLKAALDAGRLDLLLQPIVTLPQRKIRWYEIHVRVKTERGEVMLADDVVPIAEEGGLAPELDRLVLFRAVHLLKRLQPRNREVGLVMGLSPASLGADERFGELVEFLGLNKQVAPAMTFEVAHAAYRRFGPVEHEAMAAIAAHGYRFGLDRVEDLRLEPRDLADRAFRFVKIPAEILLAGAAEAGSDIHPADLAGLLARYGVELVADRIEAEATVVDLLDHDVRFGQGYLFSPPRPVRADLLGEDGPPAPRRAAS